MNCYQLIAKSLQHLIRNPKTGNLINVLLYILKQSKNSLFLENVQHVI